MNDHLKKFLASCTVEIAAFAIAFSLLFLFLTDAKLPYEMLAWQEETLAALAAHPPGVPPYQEENPPARLALPPAPSHAPGDAEGI